MEPFVLALLANGSAHGYGIVGELAQLGITERRRRRRPGLPDAAGPGAGQAGAVHLDDGDWPGATGLRAHRRTGWEALDEWAAVMKERTRLVAEFDALYLQWVAFPRPSAE